MWKRQNHSTSVFRSRMNVHFSSETINFHRITSDSAVSLQKHKKDKKKTNFYWININWNIKFHISLGGNQIKSLVLTNSRLEFHFNPSFPSKQPEWKTFAHPQISHLMENLSYYKYQMIIVILLPYYISLSSSISLHSLSHYFSLHTNRLASIKFWAFYGFECRSALMLTYDALNSSIISSPSTACISLNCSHYQQHNKIISP